MTEPGVKVPFPLFELWKKQATIKSTYAAINKDFEEAIKLIEDNKIRVKEMITHRLPLKDIQKGFDLVAEAKESLKVVIEI